MTKELKEVLGAIDAVLTDPRANSGQRDQLLRAQRELVRLARTREPNRRDVFRVVRTIAVVSLEISVKEVARRPG